MPELVHAFDIEATHPKVGDRRLMSVAAVCLELPTAPRRFRGPSGPGQVVDSFFGVVEWPDGLDVSDAGTAAFWRAHPAAWKASTEGGAPPAVVARRLHEHIAAVQLTAERRRIGYKVLTDNAFYDPGWIDWFLATHGPDAALPLQHHSVKGYMSARNKVDVSQRYEALRELRLPYKPFVDDGGAALAHHPLHDATRIARSYEHYRNVIRSL